MAATFHEGQRGGESARGALLELFSPKARLQALGLLAMMTVGALLEVLGIGLVAPLVALLTNAETALAQPYLRRAYEWSGAGSIQGFVYLTLAAFLAVIVLKNAYLAVLAAFQYRFLYTQQAQLSRRLFDGYMAAPYALHLHRHSSDVARNLLTEVNAVFSGVVSPFLQFTSEAILLVLLLATLLVAMPGKTMVVVIAGGGAVAVIFLLLRRALDRFGTQRVALSGKRIRAIGDALGGIKEAKILGRVEHFREAFAAANDSFLNASQVFATLNALPRLLIETLAMALLVGAFFLLARSDADMTAAVPGFVLLCAVALRLVPAASRILSTLNTLRFYRPALQRLHRDILALEPRAAPPAQPVAHTGPIALTRGIHVLNPRYAYPGVSEPAIAGVSMTIPAGMVCGFVGPSGAGKSTLADLILGVLDPQAGSILADGVAIHDRIRDWQGLIGYVPQTIHLLDEAVRNNVAYGLAPAAIDDARVWSALKDAQLESMVRGLPMGLDAKIGEHGARISGGQRQRLGVARALYHDPRLLVLDEATSALDVRTERAVSETLLSMRGKRTIIVIAHRLDTIRRCDLLFYLDDGRLVASGTYDALMSECEAFAALMGAATL